MGMWFRNGVEERGCGYRVKKDRISLRLKLVHLFQDDLR
jgi:hypothetical protein